NLFPQLQNLHEYSTTPAAERTTQNRWHCCAERAITTILSLPLPRIHTKQLGLLAIRPLRR
ncbi:hypothetical protein, partial [Pseudomonas aeruginosa]|uniref:hypothetical protein n=1 Tax=Pseudomonas aeruginosa TaxID=287 RepID=UPI0031B7A74A